MMKKMLAIPLDDEEIIELCRVLMDKDAEGALEFLQTHVKGMARDLLEGG
jgi:pyruvate-formate lyase-activating enzyme